MADRRPHGRLRRKIAGGVVLGIALITTGGLYTVLAPQPQVATAQSVTTQGGPRQDETTQDEATQAALLAEGREHYNNTCISCHGANLQGVQGRAPSLIGTGEAAVFFQVSSGRMPLARQEAQALRKPAIPEFDTSTAQGRQNLRELGAYIQAHGGGPQLPEHRGSELIGDDPARGGELFRLNCASCHNFTGRGGALPSGKFAPVLKQATPEQIYAAMLSGPQAMPTFGDRQIAPGEKEDMIAYIISLRGERNTPGGFNLGEYGPSTEGLVAFAVGMVALVAITTWLGAKA